MIAPLWRGVDRLVVACDGSGSAADARLCAVALPEARRNAPLNVAESDVASSPRRGDAIVRLWIADPQAEGGALLLMVAMRRGIVVDDAQGANGNGLLTRPVALSGSDDAALSAGVVAAFDRVLPWRRKQGGKSVRSRRS